MKTLSILLIVLGFFGCLISRMMKIMHWPHVNIFWYGGIIMTGIGIYKLVTCKKIVKQTQAQLTEEAISIFLAVRQHITDNSDFTWAGYSNAKDLRDDIDKYISQLSLEKRISDEAYGHFMPTATFQEHSMANGWTAEYLLLAEKFDKICEELNGN
jgi:hypothetical protein